MTVYPEDIDGSFIPLRRMAVTGVELNHEGVLLDEARGLLHLLSPVASIVWSCLDGSVTIDELATELSAAFCAELEVVRRDVLALTQELGRQGLLEGVMVEQPSDSVL